MGWVVTNALGKLSPICMDVFTLPESAKFLGKSIITFKRWINDNIIPPPILSCTSYNYMHYSLGELQSIVRILKEHEKNYEYLSTANDKTINQLWHDIEEYRKSNWFN